MATVDNLEIVISAKATSAAESIDTLSRSLSKLSRTATKFSVENFTIQLQNIASAINGVSFGNLAAINSLSSLARSFASLGRTTEKFSADNFTNQITQCISSVELFGGVSEKAVGNLERISNSLAKIPAKSQGISKVAAEVDKVGKATRTAGKEASKASGFFGKFFKSIGRIAFYRFLRSVLKAITQGLKEGIQNLYKYSDAINGTFAKSMDTLATSMQYLKNGFATAFAPLIELVVPWIDAAVDKIVEFINAMNEMFAYLSGKNSFTKAIKVAKKYGDEIDGVKKSADEAKKSLMGFDEINRLTDSNNGSGSGSADDATMMFEEEVVDIGEALGKWKIPVELTNGIDDLKVKLKNAFDGINFGRIGDNLKGVLDNALKLIDPFVRGAKAALSGLVDFATSVLADSIRITAALFDVGSGIVAAFMEQNAEKIGKWGERIGTSIGNIFHNLAGISDGLTDIFVGAIDDAYDEIVGGFSSLLTGAWDIFSATSTIATESVEEATRIIKKRIDDSKDHLRKVLADTLKMVSGWADSIGMVLSDIGTDLQEWWDTKAKPLWDKVVNMVLDIGEQTTRVWDEHIVPVLNSAKVYFDELWTKHLEPLWKNILEFISSVTDFVTEAWNDGFKPTIDSLITILEGPTIAAFNGVWATVSDVFGSIADVVSGILETFSGLLTFLSGAFSGDWKKAWEGVKGIFSGIWDSIGGICTGVLNGIISAVEITINSVWGTVVGFLNGVLKKAGEVVGMVTGQSYNWSISFEQVHLNRLDNSSAFGAGSLIKPNNNKKYEGQAVAGKFATGGFPEDGLFFANHNELVGQFSNGKTAVANNAQIVEGIKEGVYEAVFSAMNNSNNNDSTVNVYLDGKKIAEQTTKRQWQTQRAMGV